MQLPVRFYEPAARQAASDEQYIGAHSHPLATPLRGRGKLIFVGYWWLILYKCLVQNHSVAGDETQVGLMSKNE